MTLLITGETQIYGIFGYPVKHTFSPPMQNAAFQAVHRNAVYLPFEVHPDQLATAVEGLRSLQIAGVNVTVPHKIEIIPYLDHVTSTALRIGAVNTIRNDAGRLIGTNTDGLGFVRSLEELSFHPEGSTIGILGAGGSTRSILVALAEANAQFIYLVNRTAHRAQRLAEEFDTRFPDTQVQAVSLDQLYGLSIDLLINTTTVGMKDDLSPADLHRFHTLHHVADIIYSPSQTPLLKQAEALNIPAINGIGMLLYQGCEAFRFWTNQTAPTEIMRAQLLQLLQPRI